MHEVSLQFLVFQSETYVISIKFPSISWNIYTNEQFLSNLCFQRERERGEDVPFSASRWIW